LKRREATNTNLKVDRELGGFILKQIKLYEEGTDEN